MSEYVEVSDLDNDFATASERPPDGQYDVVLRNTRFKWLKTKPPERAFEFLFEISSGAFSGTKISKIAFLRPNLMHWLKTDLSRLGVAFGKLTELQQRQSILHGIQVRIELKTKTDRNNNERQNVFIIKADETAQPAERGAPPSSVPENDIPF